MSTTKAKKPGKIDKSKIPTYRKPKATPAPVPAAEAKTTEIQQEMEEVLSESPTVLNGRQIDFEGNLIDATTGTVVATMGDYDPATNKTTAEMEEELAASKATKKSSTMKAPAIETVLKDHDWRKFEYHEYAGILPMMSDQEIGALKDDIRRYGQRQKIKLVPDTGENGQPDFTRPPLIIDGRNRHQAHIRLDGEGIKSSPAFEWTDPENLFSQVISLNVQRRQLNQSQRACIGAELQDVLEERIKAGLLKYDGDLRDMCGVIMNVSGRYISQAAKLRKEASDLYETVKDGLVTVSQALTTLRDRKETPGGVNASGGATLAPRLVRIGSTGLVEIGTRVTSSGSKVLTRREALSLIRMLNHYIEKYGLEYPDDMSEEEAG